MSKNHLAWKVLVEGIPSFPIRSFDRTRSFHAQVPEMPPEQATESIEQSVVWFVARCTEREELGLGGTRLAGHSSDL